MKNGYKSLGIWTHIFRQVLLIIIPMKNGYKSLGIWTHINPTFSGPNPDRTLITLGVPNGNWRCDSLTASGFRWILWDWSTIDGQITTGTSNTHLHRPKMGYISLHHLRKLGTEMQIEGEIDAIWCDGHYQWVCFIINSWWKLWPIAGWKTHQLPLKLSHTLQLTPVEAPGWERPRVANSLQVTNIY